MSSVIGLALASDELRAVLVRDDIVRWAARAGRDDERELAAQIAALLAQAPAPRWPRPRVVASIGPAASQVRRLTGLPPIGDPAQLARLVRESAGRFFLRNGIALETTAVRPVEPGIAWAAALEQTEVTAVEVACRMAAFPLRAIVPAVVALGAAIADGELAWHDGRVRAELAVRASELVSARRVPAPGEAPDSSAASAIAALAPLGEERWRFADAYGATRVRAAEPLALRSSAQTAATTSRRRIILAAVAAGTAAVVAIVAPVLTTWAMRVRATHQLALVAPSLRGALTTEHDLDRLTSALHEVARFERERRPPTTILAHLTHALPPGASLVAIRADSAEGTLVLLAPRAAAAMAALDTVPDLVAPETIGPITKEVVGTRELERATVRFRLAPTARP
jgi:hypothetical protein